MFDEIILEFEVANMKNDNLFEAACSKLTIKAYELARFHDDNVFTESEANNYFAEEVGKYTAAVKTYFETIIAKIKELIQKITLAIETEIAKKQINKKLKYLKKHMSKVKKSKMDGSKIKIFDTIRYTRDYTKYINAAVESLKKVYNKEYENYDEFLKAVYKNDEELDKLAENLDLTYGDKYVLEVNIHDAYQYTVKEQECIDSLRKSFEETLLGGVKTLQSLAENEDDMTKIKHIKSTVSSLISKCTAALRNIVKSLITKVNAILHKSGASQTAMKHAADVADKASSEDAFWDNVSDAELDKSIEAENDDE